ncbi:NUDIX hydrolase [Bacillus sp. LL01]|uniref:NUDIX domain-containing protein n=1 Tax=Bacillus sp. LL01 TaxID=1665556 RepID=UPI00064D4B4F|nr:NUDIX hydrolase [Bacillus sp. LL01]KMJ58349.1 NUDIX hydrolase [Bacillus sp. LL01]
MKIRQAVGAIVTIREHYVLILKTKINTTEGKNEIVGEWDFIKGGVEERDSSLQEAILRELKEETGMDSYSVECKLEEKIKFEFPEDVAKRIGFHSQETTMFLVECKGNIADCKPLDDEISEIGIFKKEEVLRMLSHEETKRYFSKHCL